MVIQMEARKIQELTKKLEQLEIARKDDASKSQQQLETEKSRFKEILASICDVYNFDFASRLEEANIYGCKRSVDFDFKQVLGAGGFGVVHKATNKLDHRDYALKEVKIGVRGGEIEKRKRREVLYHSRLNHRHVVRYFGSWIERTPCAVDANDYTMFIQLELCTNRTLDAAIKSKLWAKDASRRAKLFLQIVEGLDHIHKHNIIHRDLKPKNILLDANDDVKIGDFGIATKSEPDAADDSFYGTQTRSIGTFLYMAPEIRSLSNGESNVRYNQKVDIYSLGIIFFEMYYPWLGTKSDRIKVFTDLQRPQIVFPPDATQYLTPERIGFVKWLIDHDVSQRPTADELMDSIYLELLHDEVAERSDKLMGKVKISPFSLINMKAFQFVTSELTKIFQSYKAIRFFVPFELTSASADGLKDLVKFGNVKSSPHDLRLHFARHLVLNQISQIRRYSIEKILLPLKRYEYPMRVDECAFDIVTTKENLSNCTIPEVEILNLVYAILNEFDCLKRKAFVLRLNHTKILRGLLTYFGVDEDKHSSVLETIAELNDDNLGAVQLLATSKPILKGHLLKDKILTGNRLNGLLKFLEQDKESIEELKKYFNEHLTAKEVHHLRGIEMVNQALSELDSIINTFDACDDSLCIELKFTPLIMNRNYSGTIFQLEVTESLGKTYRNILAIGGRYDELINQFAGQSSSNHKRDLIAVGLTFDIWQLTRFLTRKKRNFRKKRSQSRQRA